MSMKLVTEVDRKLREWKSIIFIEDEIICLDRERQRAIVGIMNEKDVLRVLHHLTALALEELEEKKERLLRDFREITVKLDELVQQASSGVFYDWYNAEVSMESIIKEVRRYNELYDQTLEALEVVNAVYEHMYELYKRLPDLIILYNKSGLWM